MKRFEPRNVRPYNQDQMELFPPNVRSLIENDHLCLVVNDVVRELNLSCLYQKIASEGNPPYHPAMMLKILFYAYAKGIFSSRKIAEALREHIPFIFLSAWQTPDFLTISRHPYKKELRQTRQKLDSDKGKAIYGQRKHTVEPPFGHIKSIMGFTSFLLRRIGKVKNEFKIISIAHNLQKVWLYLRSHEKNLCTMLAEAGWKEDLN